MLSSRKKTTCTSGQVPGAQAPLLRQAFRLSCDQRAQPCPVLRDVLLVPEAKSNGLRLHALVAEERVERFFGGCGGSAGGAYEDLVRPSKWQRGRSEAQRAGTCKVGKIAAFNWEAEVHHGHAKS